ncbi:MAG: YesL family protein [Oscillospiraceae bacterium]|nr:YesL family protein [Oscillospiraceae bacterium]
MAFFGFFDYNKAGKGVAKNAPEKRAFFRFWELFTRKFWKFFYINMLYVLFCIPIITIGPATVALTQIMRKFTTEQPIFVFDEFWRAFKRNFKQGFIVGLFTLIFLASFTVTCIYFFLPEIELYYFNTMPETTLSNMVIMSLSLAAGMFIWMMHFYIYPQITALSLSLNQIIKNSLLLVVLGIKQNLVTLLFSALIVIVMVLFVPYSVFLLPFIPFAWLNFLMVFNSYPVIQKYIITPYYEARGEKNPEIPDYSESKDSEESLFEDFGGREAEIKSKPKVKGKVIR